MNDSGVFPHVFAPSSLLRLFAGYGCVWRHRGNIVPRDGGLRAVCSKPRSPRAERAPESWHRNAAASDDDDGPAPNAAAAADDDGPTPDRNAAAADSDPAADGPPADEGAASADDIDIAGTGSGTGSHPWRS